MNRGSRADHWLPIYSCPTHPLGVHSGALGQSSAPSLGSRGLGFNDGGAGPLERLDGIGVRRKCGTDEANLAWDCRT